MESKTKWEAVKDRVTKSPSPDPEAALEANLESADPELCIRLLQVGPLTDQVLLDPAESCWVITATPLQQFHVPFRSRRW